MRAIERERERKRERERERKGERKSKNYLYVKNTCLHSQYSKDR